MIRILIYGLTDNLGGVENFLLNYISHFNFNIFQIDLISNTENPVFEEEFKRLGCNVYKVCSKRKNPFQFRKDMQKIFESNHYDIMWANLCGLANIDYLKYAQKYDVPIRIVHCHSGSNMFGVLKGYLHLINKHKIESVGTHYWACAYQAAQWFYPKNILSHKNFSIVNNAINTNKFLFNERIRDQYRKKLNLNDKFVIGCIGRLSYKKNIDFLIQIMNELKDVERNIHLLIIGGGDLEDKLRERVRILKLDQNVSFLGVRDDIPQLLQAIDVFVMPSLVEGLPVSAVEAQAAGVHCLMSDTITTEIKITTLVKFLPIKGDEAIQKWIEAILMLKNGYIRQNMKKDIVTNNYEIETEAKRVQSFFLKVTKVSSDSV